MKINEQVTLTLSLPSPSDTTPIWSISDGTVVQLAVDPNGYSAVATALKAGEVTVGVVCNCDQGSGVCQHVSSFPLSVVLDGSEPVVVPVVVEDNVEEDSPYWKNPDGN